MAALDLLDRDADGALDLVVVLQRYLGLDQYFSLAIGGAEDSFALAQHQFMRSTLPIERSQVIDLEADGVHALVVRTGRELATLSWQEAAATFERTSLQVTTHAKDQILEPAKGERPARLHMLLPATCYDELGEN